MYPHRPPLPSPAWPPRRSTSARTRIGRVRHPCARRWARSTPTPRPIPRATTPRPSHSPLASGAPNRSLRRRLDARRLPRGRIRCPRESPAAGPPHLPSQSRRPVHPRRIPRRPPPPSSRLATRGVIVGPAWRTVACRRAWAPPAPPRRLAWAWPAP